MIHDPLRDCGKLHLMVQKPVGRIDSGARDRQGDSVSAGIEVGEFQVASKGSTSASLIAIHSGVSRSSFLRSERSSQISTMLSKKWRVSIGANTARFFNSWKLWKH
jgi:hypothetical protein